ncbi:MAG: deferrochelatase/peroxidase EfeB [Myxococcota bacterium]|jgi:deferrochelatase/peroxidase EfeB
MPGTQADILLHLNSKRVDLCFELADRIRIQLGSSVEVVEEVASFRYLDQRDLTGFIDGTENPEGDELEIVRHSMPYGTCDEKGLFFIAYCADRSVFDRMLQAMVGEDGTGTQDEMLNYTKAVTGHC